jgi:hypothetical protein
MQVEVAVILILEVKLQELVELVAVATVVAQTELLIQVAVLEVKIKTLVQQQGEQVAQVS